MEDLAESAEGVLGRDGVVSADAGPVFQGSDNRVDDFRVVVIEGLNGAKRFDEVVILETRDAEDVVAGLSCELHATGADAAARTPDDQRFASGALASRHLQSEGGLLEKAGGGRVDA